MQVAVYHTLPFADLAPLDAMNDDMKELQDRRACIMTLNRLRGIPPRKQRVPAIVSLYNKVMNKKGPTIKKIQAGRIKKVAEKFQGQQGNLATTGRRKIDKANQRRTSGASSNLQFELESPVVKDSRSTQVVDDKEKSAEEHLDVTDEEDLHMNDHEFPHNDDYPSVESRSNVKSVSFMPDV